MNLLIWIIVSVLLLSGFGSNASLRHDSHHRLVWIQRYETALGLTLPEDLRHPVMTRLGSLQRWTMLSGAGGIALGAGIVLAMDWQAEQGSLVLLTMLMGASLGGTLAIHRGTHRLRPDSPRYARAHSTRVADYVPPRELLSARIAPTAAVITALAAWGILELAPLGRPETGTWSGWLAAMWVAVALTVLAWGAAEMTAHRLLRAPQHAASELELAWDDVCRAGALRGLYRIPLGLAGLTCLAGLASVGLVVTAPEVREAAMDQTLLVGLIMAAVTVIGVASFALPALAALGTRPRRWVLRRLWHGAPATEDATEGQ